MSTPRTTEGTSIGTVQLAIFALILLAPLLNLRFTFYYSTLKLFVFQTAVAALWCHVLWQWSTGRLSSASWPAYWLFVPLALWVGWGLLTTLWSPQDWLATGWVVRGATGLAGALGLSLLLRERGLRHMFVAAGSAVALILALFMAVLYGDPATRFFGDPDLSSREVGAAFLLVPTLAVAAMLYRLAAEEDERGYRSVLWTVLVLFALVLAGIRTGSAAWLYGLAVGLAVVVWLMVPRWRLGAALLVVLALVAVVHREARLRVLAADFLSGHPFARQALLDEADRGVLGHSSTAKLVVGNGVGTFLLALDRDRAPKTYAVARGDNIEGHARRHALEALFERGILGVVLALGAGLACVVAGTLVRRRARDETDAALGAGLAAGVVAIGVYACFANGSASFGAGMAFWLAAGLLGALSIACGRAAALSSSPQEEVARAEAGPQGRRGRGVAALAGGLVAVAAWFVFGVRPFWGEYTLREGEAEHETSLELAAQRTLLRRGLRRLRRMRHPKDKKLDQAIRGAEEKLRQQTAGFLESVERAEACLRRAAALSLGDRAWLNAQIKLALCEAARGGLAGAADRYRFLEDLCGPALDLGVLRANCYARLGRSAEAHELYRRYARKNPFAVRSALFRPRTPIYARWLGLIHGEQRKKDPRWRHWGRHLVEAARAGLAIDPHHYALLSFRGDMFYRLGQKEQSRHQMARAAALIEDHLKTRRLPLLVQARLLVDLANASFHWDKDKAYAAAQRVESLNIDPRDPRYRDPLEMAKKIRDAIKPPKERLVKPSEKKPPKTKKPPARPKTTPKPKEK